MSEITPTEAAQIKSMLRGAEQLSECLNIFAAKAVSPQLKDELGKLAADSENHKKLILSMLGGDSQ